MKCKNTMLLSSLILLVGFCLFPHDSYAFAQPIVTKANELIGYLITIIRICCILMCAVIFLMALFGQIRWRWGITVLVVAVCVGPGWNAVKNFVGVNNAGGQAQQAPF